MFQATKEQIQDWKKKHGDVFHLVVADKACYLRKPDRKVLSYAAAAGKSDPMKVNETILKNCWLDGDMEIQTNDAYFLGASGKLDKMVEVKEAELEKL
ncbi:MAG: hypothetical protein IJ204_06480 [Paludibacteraceae bacterium]|nr:hypothetical protein [Paludibacteraceae bacterium]